MRDLSPAEMSRTEGGFANWIWAIIGYVGGEILDGIYAASKDGG